MPADVSVLQIGKRDDIGELVIDSVVRSAKKASMVLLCTSATCSFVTD